MKEVKKHIQNEYIHNAFIVQNWKDICIADIPKSGENSPNKMGEFYDIL